MKDYKITKIWASTISDISWMVDQEIENQKEIIQRLQHELDEDANLNQKWELEQIEEYEEKIKALEWILNTINAPFKITKK